MRAVRKFYGCRCCAAGFGLFKVETKNSRGSRTGRRLLFPSDLQLDKGPRVTAGSRSSNLEGENNELKLVFSGMSTAEFPLPDLCRLSLCPSVPETTSLAYRQLWKWQIYRTKGNLHHENTKNSPLAR